MFITENEIRRISEISAIITSLLLFIAITIVSFAIPNYSLRDGYVSFLGSSASPFQAIINAAFAMSGLAALGLAYFLAGAGKEGSYARLGALLLGIGGLGLVLLALFPTDPVGVGTVVGKLHQIIGNFTYILIPFSMIAFAGAFRREKEWGPLFANFSLALAGVTLVCSIILKFFPFDYGLLERIGMGADLVWIVLVSFHLYLKERTRYGF